MQHLNSTLESFLANFVHFLNPPYTCQLLIGLYCNIYVTELRIFYFYYSITYKYYINSVMLVKYIDRWHNCFLSNIQKEKFYFGKFVSVLHYIRFAERIAARLLNIHNNTNSWTAEVECWVKIHTCFLLSLGCVFMTMLKQNIFKAHMYLNKCIPKLWDNGKNWMFKSIRYSGTYLKLRKLLFLFIYMYMLLFNRTKK